MLPAQPAGPQRRHQNQFRPTSNCGVSGRSRSASTIGLDLALPSPCLRAKVVQSTHAKRRAKGGLVHWTYIKRGGGWDHPIHVRFRGKRHHELRRRRDSRDRTVSPKGLSGGCFLRAEGCRAARLWILRASGTSCVTSALSAIDLPTGKEAIVRMRQAAISASSLRLMGQLMARIAAAYSSKVSEYVAGR